MTKILAPLVVEYINNSNYVQLHDRFGFISEVLKKNGLRQVGWELRQPGHEDEIWAEEGFVFDFESTPNLIRGPLGENKRGGAAHDIVCREGLLVCWNGACSGITKSIAADVYFEIMEYCDSINLQRFEEKNHPYLSVPIIVPYVATRDWLRRWTKSTVVRVWPGDFFQKYTMTATAEEIYGIKCDPYVTLKLDAAIKESEQATASIKEIPAQVESKADLVEASEQVTTDLKEAKKESQGG